MPLLQVQLEQGSLELLVLEHKPLHYYDIVAHPHQILQGGLRVAQLPAVSYDALHQLKEGSAAVVVGFEDGRGEADPHHLLEYVSVFGLIELSRTGQRQVLVLGTTVTDLIDPPKDLKGFYLVRLVVNAVAVYLFFIVLKAFDRLLSKLQSFLVIELRQVDGSQFHQREAVLVGLGFIELHIVLGLVEIIQGFLLLARPQIAVGELILLEACLYGVAAPKLHAYSQGILHVSDHVLVDA